MKISKEEKKAEALKRLKMLKVHSNVIKEFEKEGLVNYSEDMGGAFRGILYWISNEPEFEKIVEDFEKEYGGMVYHAHLCHTEFGDLLSLLYVSDHKSEWATDEADLKEGFPVAYVYNIDGDFADIGSIQIAPCNGGITRLA